MKVCDNTSVGVIVTNGRGDYLMFDRATFPPGTAPAAGHIDDHGQPVDAARAEVAEELGLTVVTLEEVAGGWRNNRCRRLPGRRGVGHLWTVYRATVTGDLDPSVRETNNVRWLPADSLQSLADRTAEHAHGRLTGAEFTDRPGLEPVWVQWLADTGAIRLDAEDLTAIDLLAAVGTHLKEN